MRAITRKLARRMQLGKQMALFCTRTSPSDGPVEEEVEKAEQEAGDKSHHKKVGQEDVAPHNSETQYSTLPSDGLVEEEVEKAEQEEGHEGHHKKVGEEDIVSHIDGVTQHLTW